MREKIYITTRRICYDQPLAQNIKITELDIINRLKNVLRLKKHDLIRIFNEEAEYLYEINEISKKEILLTQNRILRTKQHIYGSTVAICLTKPEYMASMLEIACSFNAKIIQIVISKRAQHYNIKYEKYRTYLKEATIQCERLDIPKLKEAVTLTAFLKEYRNNNILIANEHFGINISELLTQGKQYNTILIGPEGGFSSEDLEEISRYENITNLTLGDNILKSEIALAKMMSLIEILKINPNNTL